jgi:carbon-monoxide dehydrogenase medium subunit
MKPRLQYYHNAATVEEAVALLSEFGDEARVIAGGQSLVPLMNFRLTKFTHLVDINHIDDLRFIELDGISLTVGAGVRQRELEQFLVTRGLRCLLLSALLLVGHPITRNRGTVVGSLVHADPAAELPVVHKLLSGQIRAQAANGERCIEASDFYVGAFETDLGSAELALSATFDLTDITEQADGVFDEVSIRHGDFALASVGVLSTDESLRIGLGNLDLRPIVVEADRSSPRGHEDVVRKVLDAIEPTSDIHASATYKSKAAEVLIRRALGTLEADRRDFDGGAPGYPGHGT